MLKVEPDQERFERIAVGSVKYLSQMSSEPLCRQDLV